MTYQEFKKTVQKLPIIFTRELIALLRDRQALRNQLDRWSRKDLLIRLRKGAYLLNEADRKITPSRAYIANQLYGPSYVSLEYAMQYHGFIPEMVLDVTSVTSRKTLRLANELGTFIYQHVKPEAFRGFKAVKDDNGIVVFIAEPEKALVDFIYLNIERFKEGDENVFEESFRMQNLGGLNEARLMEHAGLFGSGKLVRVCKLLCGIIGKERKR